MNTNMEKTEKRWWIGWLVAFLAFPIGGLLSTALVGKLETPLQGIIGGLIAGAVIGLFQLLALRVRLAVGWTWLAATAIGLAAGVGIGVALFGAGTTLDVLLQRAIPAGLAVSIAQALVLWRHTQSAWRAILWIPTITVFYTLGWFITAQVIGQSVNQGFIVFGASGAITFQALSGLVLWALLRGSSIPRS